MARRRMFSLDIVDTDKFLDLAGYAVLSKIYLENKNEQKQ